MSAESAREFVDSNVLVYAFDSSAEAKHAAAQRLLAGLWERETGCLSVQILQEFFVTVTRKVPRPLSIDTAADRVRELAVWKVFAPTADDVRRDRAAEESQVEFLRCHGRPGDCGIGL